MVGEAIEKELYEAASEGNVTKFLELHQQDRYLVERVSYAGSRNVLHIATTHGQEAIVDEVLKINPQLARNLDSQKSSPLHIAAARGHVEIAKKLLSEAPEMCWYRDGQGWNPVHVAAIKGEAGFLREILQLDPGPAMDTVHRGQTVMHLCAKHGQLEALEVLMRKLDDLVVAEDDDEETLLHCAARGNHGEIIKYLLTNTEIDKQSTNSMGKTALNIFKECHSNSELENILKLEHTRLLSHFWTNSSIIDSRNREQIMVAMVLIATMAFQATVSPPGGVWQDDTSSHRAGEAVMASTHPKIYKNMVGSSAIAFSLSLITIFLLSNQNRNNKSFISMITYYAMPMSLTFIAVTFGNSILAITPNVRAESLSTVISIVVVVFISIFQFLIHCDFLKPYWKSVRRPLRESSGGDSV